MMSSFRTEHHYVSGLALIGIGVLGAIGSLTGRLAGMLAGLFCTTALETNPSYQNNISSETLQQSVNNGTFAQKLTGH